MAYIDIICTDKTGVLTKNQLSFAAFWNEKQVKKIVLLIRTIRKK